MANPPFRSRISNLPLNYYSRFSRACVGVAGTSLLLIFAAVELQAQTSRDAGYVLSIGGNWRSTSSSKNLKQFDPLPAGAKVSAKKPITAQSFITIALFDGETIRRRCKQGNCRPPIIVSNTNRSPEISSSTSRSPAPRAPARTQEPSVTRRVTAAFESLFHSHGTYFVSVMVRDSVTIDLREAVLESISGEAALGPAFSALPRGRYHFVVKKLREDQPDVTSKSVSMDIDWDPKQPARAKAALAPGLYHLIGPGNLQSWVLVTMIDQYAETNDSFAKAIAMSREWGTEVDNASSRMFLRAFLATLAKRSEESPK